MNPKLHQVILWGLGLLTAVAVGISIFVAFKRVHWEQQYRQVSFAVTAETYLSLQNANSFHPDFAERINSVLLDAATLEVFASLKLKPLLSFAEPEIEISNEQLQGIRDAGFGLIFALSAMPVLDTPRLAVLKDAFDRFQPKGVLFVDTLTKWPLENIRRVIALLEPFGAWYGAMEFAEPQGLQVLFRERHTNWVRAHLISYRERLKLSSAEALARYERAVRERNIRLLLLNDRGNPDVFSEEIDALSERLQQTGFSLGEVPSLPSWSLPDGLPWGLSLALLATTLWLFQRLWKKFSWFFVGLSVAVVAIIVWQLQRGDDGLAFLSLSMAIIAPMCLYRALVALPKQSGLIYGLWVFLLGSITTVLGGLIQAAFLSDPVFYLKLEVFSGVKLALIEPILVIAYWEVKRRGPGVWKRLWQRPLTWGDAVLSLSIIGGLAALVLRTGNDSFIPVLPLELELRGQLETWLYARPRFKEFLVGHPVLILWLTWGIHRWKDIGILFALAGFLGQTTILNSFAHVHTPLTFTLLRVTNGLILGVLAGLLIWSMLQWGIQRWQKSASS